MPSCTYPSLMQKLLNTNRATLSLNILIQTHPFQSLFACLLVHLFICFPTYVFYLAFNFSLHCKSHTFLSCFFWSVQRGAIVNLSPMQIICGHERVKLKNSKLPHFPPHLNLRVALQLPPGTETVPLGLKRPVKPQARQAHPLKLKLTRGTLSILVVGLVSSVRWDWSRFACQYSWLPAYLHGPYACVT